ncbi:MAG TPA: Flp pilus assembly protein CpaB [Thermoanaerobaculia bacterium]|nr:Flp pilus assembly protein CpaB [Thermoanaerobaculia bacterium]
MAVAAVLGLLAALFGVIYLNEQRNRLVGSSEAMEVYVAADDIPANTAIEGGKLTTRRIPRTFVEPQSITTAEVSDKNRITGFAVVPIRQGEQILRSKIWHGKAPPLSTDLASRPGLVAVAVKMNGAQHSVHGLLQPRDRVDVLAELDFVKPPKEKFKEVRPLFYNVEVLAVNRTTMSSVTQNLPIEKVESQALERVDTVTLALSPVAAQQLILAQELPSASIWLILRTPGSGAYKYEAWNTDRLIQSQYRLWDAEDDAAREQQEILDRAMGR